MRIGIDTRLRNGPRGGIQRYLGNLAAELPGAAAEHELVFYGGPRPEGSAAGVTWRPAGLGAHLHVPGDLDLFHATNYFPPLLDRRPTVVTVHDLAIRRFPHLHPWQRRLRHRLLPAICRRAARIIAVSESTRTDLVRLLGLDPGAIDVIPLAVAGHFRPTPGRDAARAVRARYGLPEEFVLFAGSIQPRKNLPALIDAVAALPGALRLPLVIAGAVGDAERARLEQRARARGLRPGHELVLPGWVSEQDLPSLYGLARVFVYPSLWEGFGLPPLEAMACGTPVVVPRHSSLEELYADCSVQYEPDRETGLVAALASLLEDPERRAELVERGLKQARRRSWEQVAQDTLRSYARALGAG